LAIAYLDGQPIGGATFAVVVDVAYYAFGASAAEALAVNGGYLLQWLIIQWLRESGVRWHELGGRGDAGIQQLKKGLAGKKRRVASCP
jgi:lipid II:glycine glycyltransferase (peptidoglycan interpeptide bridge formation enzyme)